MVGPNAGAATSGWIVWLCDPNRTLQQRAEVARLVTRDCASRGVVVRTFDPTQQEDLNVEAGHGAMVLSNNAPPASLLSPQLLIAGGDAPPPAVAIPLACGAPPDAALDILTALERRQLIPSMDDEVYSEEEEERLRKALDDLGYL